jgi:hypothetical protein
MSDIQTRDAVHLHTLHSAIVTAYPPLYIKATNENYPAAFMGHPFSKGQAELLARTVAPQLFPEEGTEPWRKPIREAYVDLSQTVRSYGRDLFASREANWDAGALTQSLSGLLEALNGTLDRLEKLL